MRKLLAHGVYSLQCAMSQFNDRLFQLGVFANVFDVSSPSTYTQVQSPNALSYMNKLDCERPQFIQPVIIPRHGNRLFTPASHRLCHLNHNASPQIRYSAYVQSSRIPQNHPAYVNLPNTPAAQSPLSFAQQSPLLHSNSSTKPHQSEMRRISGAEFSQKRHEPYSLSSFVKDCSKCSNETSYTSHRVHASYVKNSPIFQANDPQRPLPSGLMSQQITSPLLLSTPERRFSTSGDPFNSNQNMKGMKRRHDDKNRYHPSSSKRRKSDEDGQSWASKYPALDSNIHRSSPVDSQSYRFIHGGPDTVNNSAKYHTGIQGSNAVQARSSPQPGLSQSSLTSSTSNCNMATLPQRKTSESHNRKQGTSSPLVAPSFDSPVPPADSSECKKVTAAIWRNFVNSRQSEDVYKKKLNLRNALFSMIKELFPHCGLYVVGSSMNGFGNEKSDMDMCVMVSEGNINQKKQATEILRVLHKALRKCSFIKHCQLIKAKVPILKFMDNVSGIECDININNLVGIRNTHLLAFYAKADWRVRPLVLYVKCWAKFHNINDASRCTISSYSLVLMVIHYLQFGCEQPVLPSLQIKFPAKFSPTSDVRTLRLDEDVPPYNSLNKQSLGELFLGFLKYYAEDFKFETQAISIRLGKKVPIQALINMSRDSHTYNPNQWKYLCIEEPFDQSNTARSVFDGPTFQHVRAVISRSYRTLKSSKDAYKIMAVPF